jgi:TolA-binding protein
MPEPVSLELLGQMMQRQLDAQGLLRSDVRQMRRKLDRIERAILALQRSDIDRAEADADTQEQIYQMNRRIERLEAEAAP